jgi:hypothetical protein
MRFNIGDLVIVNKHQRKIPGIITDIYRLLIDRYVLNMYVEDFITKKIYITRRETIYHDALEPFNIDLYDKNSNLYKYLKPILTLTKIKES